MRTTGPASQLRWCPGPRLDAPSAPTPPAGPLAPPQGHLQPSLARKWSFRMLTHGLRSTWPGAGSGHLSGSLDVGTTVTDPPTDPAELQVPLLQTPGRCTVEGVVWCLARGQLTPSCGLWV